MTALLVFALPFALYGLAYGSYCLGRSLARYYALALPLLLAQFLLTEGVFRAAHIADRQTILRTVIYAVVMTVLFVGSYVIQHRWVFGDQEERKRHK